MTEKTRCTRLTQRGRPCRNPAAPGTNPPACARHRERATPAPAQLALPLDDGEGLFHFYLEPPSVAELLILEATNEQGDLKQEVDVVRVVLRRLLKYLDEPPADLPAEEVRRISSLIFAGARTVAFLMARSNSRSGATPEWMAEALGEMANKWGLDL